MTTKTAKAVSASVVIRKIEADAKPLFKKLERVTSITNNDEMDAAASQLKLLKELSKAADNLEKSIIDPLHVSIKNTKELFKPFKEMVADYDSKIKQLVIDYQNHQAKLIKQVEDDYEKGKIKKATTVLDRTNELQVVSSVVTTRTVTKLKCIDAKKTPSKYMIPDTKAIEAALRDGKHVAGWELVKEKSIAI